MGLADDLATDIEESAYRAIDALSRYKFMLFGYWAAIWVHLNRIEGGKRPSPFTDFVRLAREYESRGRKAFYDGQNQRLFIEPNAPTGDIGVSVESGEERKKKK